MADRVEGRPIVSVFKAGGHWHPVQGLREGRTSLQFVGDGYTDEKAAAAAARRFAAAHHLQYQKKFFTLEKWPFITVHQIQEVPVRIWVAARFFEDRIMGAGTGTERREDAESEARELARREGLQFIVKQS